MMKHQQPDLTIIIPALREEKRIGKTLDELASFLKKDKPMSKLDTEVIVVSATSTDKTHEVVLSKKPKFKNLTLLKPGKPVGKGRDVRYAMLRAKGRAIIFMDADLATPLRHLPAFYKEFVRGSDLVIATRNLRRHHESFARRSLSNLGNLLFRIASGVWVEDSQCGFKMFSNQAAKTCFSKLQIMKWGFDMEVLAIAKANKLKITTRRINDWKSVPGGTFEGGFLGNAISSLGELAYILSNRLRGVYKD
jgi:dolichyl-phosphate beta-glucosyltransferase